MTESKRKALSKKIRFEVFKRDTFTCQYCGAKAPDVILEVDHIDPVSKGGDNDLLNLITSCKACNAGKSDRQLSDDTVLDKRRQQLADLQERREQIDMMFEWQKGLTNLDGEVLDKLVDFWNDLIPGYSLNDKGVQEVKALQRRFSFEDIMSAMRTAASTYLEYKDGKLTQESAGKAFSKIGGICFNAKLAVENPDKARIRYILGIMRRRIYVNEDYAKELLERALDDGADIEQLEKWAKRAHSWTEWRVEMENVIDAFERQ
jgi:hypothetical protein